MIGPDPHTDVVDRVRAAALRGRRCGPECRLTTVADAVDVWGERTVRVCCVDHGDKAVTFVVQHRGLHGGSA